MSCKRSAVRNEFILNSRITFDGGLLILVLAAVGSWFFFWQAPASLNLFLNKVILREVITSPELVTQLGFIDNTLFDFHSGKLDSYTASSEKMALLRLQGARQKLNEYGSAGLENQDLVSWKIMAWVLDDEISKAKFTKVFNASSPFTPYRLSHIHGIAISMPQLLTDKHAITNKRSVKRYLRRIREIDRVMSEVKIRLEEDHKQGLLPPSFVIEGTLASFRDFIRPGAKNNLLVTSLSEKLVALRLPNEAVDKYLQQAVSTMEAEVIPAYESMIAFLEKLALDTTAEPGVWRLPDGNEIYTVALRTNTGTDLTADQIHDIGLFEVTRIEQEMHKILVAQGLSQGSVAKRVQHLMAQPEHLFPNNNEGRIAMIKYLEEIDREFNEKAAMVFREIPPQMLEIKRVPTYLEDSAPGGSYNPPSLDGSRAGRFYINQKNTADHPRWTLPTLMYHEGAPGHHFQISKALLLKNLPIIRSIPLFPAYTEGWALYAEYVAKADMAMYEDDPLAELGRLQAEMFRAVRLVVDTGIHDRRWSRDQAIEYMVSTTGMTKTAVIREVERYAVWPGQATAYKIGQLKILSLRKTAEEKLGKRFDLREFHSVILNNGAMPLSLLGEVVNSWINDTLDRKAES